MADAIAKGTPGQRKRVAAPDPEPGDCETGVQVSVETDAPNGQIEPPVAEATIEIPAENHLSLARPRGLEPLTGDLEVERDGSAPASSGSQAVGIVRDRERRTVQPSQPLAPFRSPFGPPVVQGSGERGSSLPVVAGAGGRLMKVREVAEALGVCTATVYEIVDEGELPHVRVANAIRVTQADLAHYVACRRRERCGRISHR
jgi:excisionase family DNA binding protein